MANTGVSDVAVTIQKIVSALTTKTLIQNSVALAMNGVWDRSSEIGPGMDRLDMIELAELSAQAVNETGAALTPSTIVPAAAQLDLDQHIGIFFALTDRGELQSKIALASRTIENGVRTLAANVDNYIFSQGVAAAKTVETVAAADALGDLLNLKVQFDADNVPREGRAIAASPIFMKSLLGASSVVRANEFGSSDPVRMGRVASVFGIDIFESNSASIPNDGFVALGLEAVAFARQMAVQFKEQYQVLNAKTDYSLKHLYGAESTKTTLNPRIYVFNPA